MGVIKRGRIWHVRYWAEGRERWEAAGPTRALAEALLNRRKLETAEGRVLPGKRRRARFTVRDAGARWLEHAKTAKRSWKRDAVSLAHLNAHLGGKLLDQLVALDVERYKRQRQGETYRHGGGEHATAPGTINRELTLLRTMLRRAVRDGDLVRNPFDGVKLLGESPGRVTRLDPEAEARLLAACPSRLRAVVTVALHTGLRLGELLGLRWADVDLRSGLVRVERSRPGGEAGTKSGKRRDVPLNAEARGALEALGRGEPEALVFGTGRGTPYTNLPRDWRAACAAAKLRDFRFHDLRHAFASRLVENGTDLLTVAQLLGHASLAMVMRYAHLSPAHRREAVDRLSAGVGAGTTVSGLGRSKNRSRPDLPPAQRGGIAGQVGK